MDKSLTVAGYILDSRSNASKIMTPMKLNLLVYISHGFTLANLSAPLIDENVQAWECGPIVPSVYHITRKYMNTHVKQIECANCVSLSVDEKTIIDKVIKRYGDFSLTTLLEAVAKQSTPWSITWAFNENQGMQFRSLEISNSLIQHFYADVIKKPTHSSL